MKKHVITITNYGVILYEVDDVGNEHFIECKPLNELNIPNRIPPGHCGVDIGWADYPFAKIVSDLRWSSGDHSTTRFD